MQNAKKCYWSVSEIGPLKLTMLTVTMMDSIWKAQVLKHFKGLGLSPGKFDAAATANNYDYGQVGIWKAPAGSKQIFRKIFQYFKVHFIKICLVNLFSTLA